MDYEISYTLPMGSFAMRVYKWELASILRNMLHLALHKGIKFSNVTIKSL